MTKKKKYSIVVCIYLIFLSLIVQAKSHFNIEEALRSTFGDPGNIETKEVKLGDNKKLIEERLGYKLIENNFTFYLGKQEERGIYYLVLREQGKDGLIKFLISIAESGSINDIAVLESNETKGEGITKERFLRQFKGKTARDPVSLKGDIIAVTGATVSSKAAARAAKKALIIWEEAFR